MTKPSKIIVVIGPTASGKSDYAVTLAKKYHGEIISADSRQVYRDLDIGTGKVPGYWLLRKNRGKKRSGAQKEVFIYKGIPHHCIDYISPKKQYTVADFKRDAEIAIQDILKRGKTPIMCGGTGLYVDAILYDQQIPEVKPDPAYRKILEAKTTAQLFALLQKKDPARAHSIDRHNPRRLIRALEIIHATGKPVPTVQKGNPFAAKGLPFILEKSLKK
jgi:tRNA dimethylallyltransferase